MSVLPLSEIGIGIEHVKIDLGPVLYGFAVGLDGILGVPEQVRGLLTIVMFHLFKGRTLAHGQQMKHIVEFFGFLLRECLRKGFRFGRDVDPDTLCLVQKGLQFGEELLDAIVLFDPFMKIAGDIGEHHHLGSGLLDIIAL